MNTKKNLIYGFLTWLIPFVVSFAFYKPEGELVISYDLFKSIMIVVASATGCYFLSRYFAKVENNFLKESLVIGVSWFTLNILLDIIILLPIMKVSFKEYFMAIGLRYLVIPIIAITIGQVVTVKNKFNNIK